MTAMALMAMRQGVIRRLLAFMFMVIAASLATTAAVHARETAAIVSLECNGAVHADGDADQSSPDNDSAVPHHHGACQGPVLDLANAAADVPARARAGQRLRPARAAPLAMHAVAPGLRPPAA